MEKDRVNFEQSSVNLDNVKKEVDSEELGFKKNQYKIILTFENVFGESLSEQRNNSDNLIGFIDGDVIMETGQIKLEDVKEEVNEDVLRKNLEESYSEIIHCHCCKVWLDKQEYLKNHIQHCLDSYSRLRHNVPKFQESTEENVEISTPNDRNRSYLSRTKLIESKCSDGSDKTNQKRHQATNTQNLKIHLSTDSDVKQFQCDTCPKKFSKKDYLILHIRNKHSNAINKRHKCPACPYQTNKKSHFTQHLNTYNNIKLFQCDICKKRFSQKSNLNMHMKNMHSNTNEKKHKCSKCSYQTNYKTTFKTHLNTHTDIGNTKEKEFKCSKCSFQSNYKSCLKTHLIIHSDFMPFQCDLCKTRFSQKGNLKVHIENNHLNINEKKYKCPECPYLTNKKSRLKEHLNTHKDVKPFECDICKKKFSQKGNLNVHIENTHSKTKEKKNKCPQCPYQTNKKNHLKEHLNTHSDVKPFQCSYCKKRFSRSGLKQHMRRQHLNISVEGNKFSEKPKTYCKGSLEYTCDICKKKFKKKNDLKLHIKCTHSLETEKEYKCSLCSFQTNYKRNLKPHLNTHNDFKQFACDICKKGFSRKDRLNEHVKNDHPGSSFK